MQHDPLVLAYLAGMIDGDGYITINRSQRGSYIYHAPQVGIGGVHRAPHDLAASLWGGNVGLYMPKIPGHLGQYQWSRQGSSAVAVIEAVLPYLRIKQDNAVLALELWEHVEFGRGDNPFPWFGPHYDPIAARDEMRGRMIGLNNSRSRLRKKREAALADSGVSA